MRWWCWITRDTSCLVKGYFKETQNAKNCRTINDFSRDIKIVPMTYKDCVQIFVMYISAPLLESISQFFIPCEDANISPCPKSKSSVSRRAHPLLLIIYYSLRQRAGLPPQIKHCYSPDRAVKCTKNSILIAWISRAVTVFGSKCSCFVWRGGVGVFQCRRYFVTRPA